MTGGHCQLARVTGGHFQLLRRTSSGRHRARSLLGRGLGAGHEEGGLGFEAPRISTFPTTSRTRRGASHCVPGVLPGCVLRTRVLPDAVQAIVSPGVAHGCVLRTNAQRRRHRLPATAAPVLPPRHLDEPSAHRSFAPQAATASRTSPTPVLARLTPPITCSAFELSRASATAWCYAGTSGHCVRQAQSTGSGPAVDSRSQR